MARSCLLALTLALTLAIAHGRELNGIKVTVKNDPTTPIFTSTTSGGINVAGTGINVVNSQTVTAVKNVDKHTGESKTTFVKAEGSALSVGKAGKATVAITSKIDPRNGNLKTVVDTAAIGLKPKLTAVDASIEQKEVATGFFAGPGTKVIADSRAAVNAAQVEKKANSGVVIAAFTNAQIDPATQTASAKQSTFVGDFATGVHNPNPNSKQNQKTFGQVTAVDKNGNVVFQETSPPSP